MASLGPPPLPDDGENAAALFPADLPKTMRFCVPAVLVVMMTTTNVLDGWSPLRYNTCPKAWSLSAVKWHAILDVLLRVCDGDPGRRLRALWKLQLLEKQPGGREQFRDIFLESDVDIRQLLAAIPA